jgi:phage-related tail fiber protein
LTGDATGSGTGSFAVTLANSGATAGTYKSVTINAKGLVTGGTNPTTLSGYGITDAIPSSDKGANSGVAELDNKGVLKSSHLPFAAMLFLAAHM